MNYHRLIAIVLAAVFMTAVGLTGQTLPDGFAGKVIAQGEKPDWLPDSKSVSYSHDNGFYIYELKKGEAKKITDVNIAEYVWLDDKTALVIEWPDNVTEKKRVEKIINYWLIEKGGKKKLLAADTALTNRIPEYHTPIKFSNGVYALRKSPGWNINEFVQNENFVALTKEPFDLDTAVKNFRYVTWSNQEGGTIFFKNIDRDTEKTVLPGQYHTDIRMSDDYSRMLTYTAESSNILDSNGAVVFDLMDFIDPGMQAGLDKMFGGVWNSTNDGVAYYEIYETPEKYYTLNYFDLNSGQKTVLTPTIYYSKKGIVFAPDNSAVVTYFIQDNVSYITVIDLPSPTQPTGDQAR